MDIDRRRLLLGAMVLAGTVGAWGAGGGDPVEADRPRLRWSGIAGLARAGDDAALAPLALCAIEDGGPDPVLIEPDGTTRRAWLRGATAREAVASRLRALILPDPTALDRYAAARRTEDPALELALAARSGAMAPEAVDAVLANLVRARLGSAREGGPASPAPPHRG